MSGSEVEGVKRSPAEGQPSDEVIESNPSSPRISSRKTSRSFAVSVRKISTEYTHSIISREQTDQSSHDQKRRPNRQSPSNSFWRA